MENLAGKKTPDKKPDDVPASVAKKPEESSEEASSSSESSAPEHSPAFITQVHLLEQAVSPLPLMNVDNEVKTFSGGGVLPKAILDAGNKLKGEVEQQTLKDTIALFAYMDRHADAIGDPIDTAMTALVEGEQEDYLTEVSTRMGKKLAGFAVWGGEDRAYVRSGAIKASAWFKQGKAEFLEKSASALQASKLDLFLAQYVHTMEAKPYSRRVHSLEVDAKRVDVVKGPPVGTPIPYIQAGYTYYIWDAEDELPKGTVQPATLVAGKLYYLVISNQKSYLVTIGSNTGSQVTFSKAVEADM